MRLESDVCPDKDWVYVKKKTIMFGKCNTKKPFLPYKINK
jgi:hypothetical protein